ncbi:MAG TPA: sulfur reduction protein DsrS [Gammaproteobacteria bacterium]|nr:sulfur reduction protein DsrS [Gammaproteobacteria bacterium]
MELATEDALRLNVLLANQLHAVRIDESQMAVSALSERGEATIRLNPTGRHDQYIRKVKELISSQVLGSPGGYPVYLKRWTRMGQARDDSLEQLLMLGEPEAVVAAVHAPGLTHELARRAWWALPEADNARRMLERDCVVAGEMGQVLAEFLLEYLPFETEPQAMMESVRLILRPGLISDDAREKLWVKAKHKNTYYVGFLRAIPDSLPELAAPHPDYARRADTLEALSEQGNGVATQLQRVWRGPGQAFLRTAEGVLRKPNNQDVVLGLLQALQEYFAPVHPRLPNHDHMPVIIDQVERLCADEVIDGCGCRDDVRTLLAADPDLQAPVQAMLVLACLSDRVVTPVFAHTDAIGTVMRRKLEPVTQPILEQFARLLGTAG